MATAQPGCGRARGQGPKERSTRAAGGSVPFGLVAAALFLVLFVWGCGERKKSGGKEPHPFPGPARQGGWAARPQVGPRARALTFPASAFLLSKLLAAAWGGNGQHEQSTCSPRLPTPSG